MSELFDVPIDYFFKDPNENEPILTKKTKDYIFTRILQFSLLIIAQMRKKVNNLPLIHFANVNQKNPRKKRVPKKRRKVSQAASSLIEIVKALKKA